MRNQIARLISNILNPFLTSVILILVVSFESVTNILDALKWALTAIALSILPLGLAIIYLFRTGRLDSIFADIRSQRTKIYVPGIILAGVGGIILHYLSAPLELTGMFLAAFLSGVIFACINLWWKISLHTATMATLVTVLVILYGSMAAASIVLIPLMAWARAESRHHSLAEGITGAFLASSIIVLVFYLLGLI